GDVGGVGLFFFQAEDGIRDLIVTGVQTCALPICPDPRGGCGRALRGGSLRARRGRVDRHLERRDRGAGGAGDPQDRAGRRPVLHGQGRDVRGALQPRRRVPAPGDGGLRRADGARRPARRRPELRAQEGRVRRTVVVLGVAVLLGVGGLAWWLTA